MNKRTAADSGRTVLFVAAGLVALIAAVPFSIWLSRSPAGLDQYDRLSAEIGCLCGTCPLRPIGTCGCGFADGMLARLRAEAGDGKTDDEIMAVFVADYGSSIQIKPRGSGVGLLAWAAPIIFLMVGGVFVAAIISHWRNTQRVAPAAARTEADVAPEVGEPDVPTASDEAASTEDGGSPDRYRAIVDEELGDLDI